MTTLFISDLHLDASRPHITRLFVEFVEREASKATALYILGDLFEAWIGDDAPGDVGDAVADALAALHAQGVPTFFIHGNRDFLLGDAFARRARMTLLPDPAVVRIEGRDVLLMHGDVLCTDDAPYQAFRAETHAPRWQRAFLSRPVEERARFAEQARAESKRYTRSVADAITDVNGGAVLRAFERHATQRMIHGHTHRPCVHRLGGAEPTLERIVLGDWYEQGSVLRLGGESVELSAIG
ncbi:MAG TPA: UDP-2,3-diacylglucosamine diphosphatase [Rhodanobacteraceae bacterium]|nr:UDP-2,3-diacylglucosamine diphosphatase [Rhodanobacteraceae bacterium]